MGKDRCTHAHVLNALRNVWCGNVSYWVTCTPDKCRYAQNLCVSLWNGECTCTTDGPLGDGVHMYIRTYVHMWWLPWDTHSGLPMLRIRSTFSDLAPLSVRSTRTSFSLPFLLRNEDRSFMLKLYTGIRYSMYVRTDTPYSTHMHTQTLMHTPTYSTSYKNVNSLRPPYWYGYGRAIH